MPWVRIDENAMDHPKFVAISANAWRLWCEGMTYCQKHLTDGFLPIQGVKGMRYYSLAALRMLLASLVPGKGPLWHDADGGYRVHDYHDWNESRDRVLGKRQEAKERMDKLRVRSAPRSREQMSEQSSERTLSTPLHFTSLQKTHVHARARESQNAETDDDVLLRRAGVFVNETYPALYAKHRKGARYVSRPALDFQEAVQLVATWDDARLEQIATVFLTTDHEFAEKGSRTIAQFRSMASWCDSRLIEAGIA